MKIVNGEKYMDSVQLAEILCKEHRNIMASIKNADGVKYINDIRTVRGRAYPCVLLSATSLQIYLTVHTRTSTDDILRVMRAFSEGEDTELENEVSTQTNKENEVSTQNELENEVSTQNELENEVSTEQLSLLDDDNNDNIDSKASDIDSESHKSNTNTNKGKCFGSVKKPVYDAVLPSDFGIDIDKSMVNVETIKNYDEDPTKFIPDPPRVVNMYKKKYGDKYIDNLMKKYPKQNLQYIIFCLRNEYHYLDPQVVEIDRSLTVHEWGTWYEERQERESKKYVMTAEELADFMEQDILPWESEKTKEGKFKKSFGKTKDNDK